MWAHELPVAWHEDWKKLRWEEYRLPALLKSVQFDQEQQAILRASRRGRLYHPISKAWWHFWS